MERTRRLDRARGRSEFREILTDWNWRVGCAVLVRRIVQEDRSCCRNCVKFLEKTVDQEYLPLELVGEVAGARRRMETTDKENARHCPSFFFGKVVVESKED